MSHMALRCLCHIGSFVGSDLRVYVLHEGDVAAVPAPQARVLLGRGAAIRVRAGDGGER